MVLLTQRQTSCQTLRPTRCQSCLDRGFGPIPERAGSRRQARPARRQTAAREELLRAALALAAETPFREVTVEQIAAGAGISRSAFYLHFADKHELLLAAIDDLSAEFETLGASWWRGDGPPAEVVRRSVAALVSAYADHTELLRLATEVATYDDEVRARWLAIFDGAIEVAAEHIRSEQHAGLIPRTVEPRPTSEALVWMAERCCHVYLAGGTRGPDQVSEALAPVWTAALYPGVIPAEQLRPEPPPDAGPRGEPEPRWPAWKRPGADAGAEEDSEQGETGEGTGATG